MIDSIHEVYEYLYRITLYMGRTVDWDNASCPILIGEFDNRTCIEMVAFLRDFIENEAKHSDISLFNEIIDILTGHITTYRNFNNIVSDFGRALWCYTMKVEHV